MLRLTPKHRIIVLLIISTVFLTGCNGTIPGLAPTQTNTPVPTNTPTPTETLTPTVTPLPPVGVLLAPPEADSELVEEMRTLLSEWIPALGYRFQVRPSLTLADLDRDEFKLIVVLPPASDLGTLVAAAPEARFLAVGIQGLEPAPNLSMIGSDGDRLDHQGFIAGYMSAVITPDWRTGVIGVADSGAAVEARQAFVTGVEFFCGLCLPTYPPYFEYPLYFELNTGADTVEWLAAADFMIHRSVETVYVVPGAGDDAMLRHLAQSGVNIIGGVSPLNDIGGQWVASLRFDPFQAFQDFWPDFAAGLDGQSITVPLAITDVNPKLLSPGRQGAVEEILADVLAGFVDLGIETPEENP
ncbi:MAG: hypothetical protein KKD28_09515 [Chloroflexi bacterium]|nr:hypothetical protein [Chloroflexota bacterium]